MRGLLVVLLWLWLLLLLVVVRGLLLGLELNGLGLRRVGLLNRG